MGFFFIATPLIEKSRTGTLKEIKESVTKQGLARGGDLTIQKEKFKLGNLDTLMFMNDKLIKIEANLQSLLKKIDRQYLDINSNDYHRWEIKGAEGNVTVDKYIYRFKWNESKFPRAFTLNKIVEGFQSKITNYENQLRAKSNAYNETKTQISQTQQKEGNFIIKDLNDIIVEPAVKPSDFLYTKYVTTVIVIVPVSQIKEFEIQYEYITQNVVPGSAKRLNIPQKDNLSLWKVNLFTVKIQNKQAQQKNEKSRRNKKDLTVTQQFIQCCRQKFKAVAREFTFQPGLSDKRQGRRNQLQKKIQQQQKLLSDLCEVCFSDTYEIYMHAKVLRLIIQTNMRFGKQQTILYIIEPVPGKQKIIQNQLIDIFGDKQSQGLYGTKDQIEDTEDFFPFVYIPIHVI